MKKLLVVMSLIAVASLTGCKSVTHHKHDVVRTNKHATHHVDHGKHNGHKKHHKNKKHHDSHHAKRHDAHRKDHHETCKRDEHCYKPRYVKHVHG